MVLISRAGWRSSPAPPTAWVNPTRCRWQLGAKVVVNDFGGARDGTGGSSEAAEMVAEIMFAGGEAIANGADVSSEEQADAMVSALDQWGRIDILVNNAGILRQSFAKMEMSDWDKVVAVHPTGSAICTRAVWPVMREQKYGRVINHLHLRAVRQLRPGQLRRRQNGRGGLMNSAWKARRWTSANCVLHRGTRMTEDLMPKEVLAAGAGSDHPRGVVPGQRPGPNQRIVPGAGCYAMVRLMERRHLPQRGRAHAGRHRCPFEQLGDMGNAREMSNGGEHHQDSDQGRAGQRASKLT